MRVLILRPEAQADELSRLIEASGNEAVSIPAIEILPPRSWGAIDGLLSRIEEFDWVVFTSVNGVGAVVGRLRGTFSDFKFSGRIGAIGPRTKAELQRHGLVVDWMPTRYMTEALAEELPDSPAKVLLFRADIARPKLEERLRERGFMVERADAYRTKPINARAILEALNEGVDAICFTSASIVGSFLEAVPDLKRLDGVIVASIGPATSAVLRESGLELTVEARPHTAGGLAAALARATHVKDG